MVKSHPFCALIRQWMKERGNEKKVISVASFLKFLTKIVYIAFTIRNVNDNMS